FSDEIITVTEECKKILISRGVPENKITLVLNTPPKKVFLFDTQRKFIQNKELKLFYHGTVAKRFGLHIAIGAVQILKRNLSDVKLYIYGKYDSEYKDELQYLIKDLDLEKDIYFGDFITPEEVYSILKQCDIAVVPYMETDYMHLSLSTKAFEYAAAGISIVCTRLKE